MLTYCLYIAMALVAGLVLFVLIRSIKRGSSATACMDPLATLEKHLEAREAKRKQVALIAREKQEFHLAQIESFIAQCDEREALGKERKDLLLALVGEARKALDYDPDGFSPMPSAEELLKKCKEG